MKNIKKDIPSIIGLLTTVSLAAVSGGLVNPTLTNIGASLAASFITGFTPAKIKKWFVDVHPNDLNHNIKRLFIQSVNEALHNISILFSETQASNDDKKQTKQLIKTLQKHLPNIFLNSNQIKLEEPEIKHFLYKKDNEEIICHFIENQFDIFGITEPFKSFLTQNLPAQIQLCFGEGLKNPANQEAWIAFQRMLIEQIRNDIKQIADTQERIEDDISDLKFEKSGFSKKQIAEIHRLTEILNNKKLVEVKINESLNQSLKSIESKANEIIRITTKTQLTVDELKIIIEKIKRQNLINHIIIYALAACLLVTGVFAAYKLITFTATIQITNWKDYQEDFLPYIQLTIGGKPIKEQINSENSIAKFVDIPIKYSNEEVSIKITDIENMLPYEVDSVIRIYKNKISEIQVRLHGLEQFKGRIIEVVGENKIGVSDAIVYVNDLSTKTDERGFFIIDSIPKNKQKREQYVEVSKDGYITYTDNAMTMIRKKADDIGCELILTRISEK